MADTTHRTSDGTDSGSDKLLAVQQAAGRMAAAKSELAAAAARMVQAARDARAEGHLLHEIGLAAGVTNVTAKRWCDGTTVPGATRNHDRRQPPCGTIAGENAHRIRGEQPCEQCREARKAYMRDYRRRR